MSPQIRVRESGDRPGEDLLAGLISAGVNCNAVERGPSPSGVALITLDTHGENSIVVAPGANADLTPWDIERHSDLIRSARMRLLQLEIPLPTVQAAWAAGSPDPEATLL